MYASSTSQSCRTRPPTTSHKPIATSASPIQGWRFGTITLATVHASPANPISVASGIALGTYVKWSSANATSILALYDAPHSNPSLSDAASSTSAAKTHHTTVSTITSVRERSRCSSTQSIATPCWVRSGARNVVLSISTCTSAGCRLGLGVLAVSSCTSYTSYLLSAVNVSTG